MPTDPSARSAPPAGEPRATARPWLAAYPAQIDPAPQLAYQSIVAAWQERVAGNPGGVAVRYFDGSITAAELDDHADALAVELQQRGITRGDRYAPAMMARLGL